MGTSGYELADFDDIELFWEQIQLDVDAAFRPNFDTPSSI